MRETAKETVIACESSARRQHVSDGIRVSDKSTPRGRAGSSLQRAGTWM